MKRKTFSFYYFRSKPIELGDKYERWRGVADRLDLKSNKITAFRITNPEQAGNIH